MKVKLNINKNVKQKIVLSPKDDTKSPNMLKYAKFSRWYLISYIHNIQLKRFFAKLKLFHDLKRIFEGFKYRERESI